MSIFRPKQSRNFPPFGTHERDSRNFPDSILLPEEERYEQDFIKVAELCASPIFSEDKRKPKSMVR